MTDCWQSTPLLLLKLKAITKWKWSKVFVVLKRPLLWIDYRCPLAVCLIRLFASDPENADPTTDHYDLNPSTFELNYAWFVKKRRTARIWASTHKVYTADRKAFYYRVELTNTFGCTASDYTEVLNDYVPKKLCANAFRPASRVIDNKAFSSEIILHHRW